MRMVSGGVGIFGMGKEDWSLVRNVNRGIEETLQEILSRQSKSSSFNGASKPPKILLDAVSWTEEGPRVLISKFERKVDYNRAAQFFNLDRVRSLLAAKGHAVDPKERVQLDADYQIRHAIDLLLHIRSQGCEASDTTLARDYSDEQLRNTPAGVEKVISKVTNYASYNSPFSIGLIPPDKRIKHVSSNGPCYSQLFFSLLDGVNKTLAHIANGESYDLDDVSESCSHIDLFVGTEGTGATYVYEILDDYATFGLVKVKTYLERPSSLSDMFKNIRDADVVHLGDVGKYKADIGFSFAPCGFLLPYHLGVTSLLSELKIINTTTPLAGASAGTLNIVCATSIKPDLTEVLAICEHMSEEAMRYGVRYRIDDMMKTLLKEEIKPGTYLAVNRRIGTLSIALASKRLLSYKGMFVSQFLDDGDLMDGVRASCNIPHYSTTGSVMFRGEKCYDGYFANKSRKLLCQDTAALRTVRVTPFVMGRAMIRRQKLRNDYIGPLLMNKDRYVVHYLRLKCFLSALWRRKIDYESCGRKPDWRLEVSMIMDAYEMLSGGQLAFRQSTWSDLMKIWSFENPSKRFESRNEPKMVLEEPEIAKLFRVVIASELVNEVGRNSSLSARNFSGSLEGVNIIGKFGYRGFIPMLPLMRFRATPHCLMDWLQYEYETSSNNRHPFVANSTTQDAELTTLKAILHSLTPPESLAYHYTEFPYLLPNSAGNMHRLTVALSSCSRGDLRYLFDLGRCDAFRWLINEYISFENWLYLRIKQLEKRAKPKSGVSSDLRCNDSNHQHKNADELPIHVKQKLLLSECLDLMEKKEITKLRSMPVEGEKPQKCLSLSAMKNRLARRALMIGIIDKQYTHLLCHSYIWEG
ncbi:patatin-like phospholipase domain-containing protein [Babesia gibsoni]|uniref:Patatin-like phospholipase domain-containing protein n=1 Tax=Babesia gibsoni TaxID=33632 RepID=A0AAD8UWT6_BABGI|nr:patatin-like phospholipase domain-containing protein [Babesia gibsoni]